MKTPKSALVATPGVIAAVGTGITLLGLRGTYGATQQNVPHRSADGAVSERKGVNWVFPVLR